MTNVEIKARYSRFKYIREKIQELNGYSVGIDHQIDTYFRSRNGRLKLREGRLENNLIYYDRHNQKGPNISEVILHPVTESQTLKNTLSAAMGVDIVVDKMREIYFIDNIKIHLDRVQKLGTFVEIEAIDKHDTIGRKRLHAQCSHLMQEFEITRDTLVASSYSDMLAQLSLDK